MADIRDIHNAAANYNQDKPVGAPLTGAQQATGRPSAEYLAALARRLGRCGDIHPLTGHVCVTQPHEHEVEHMAVQIGGPYDGHVYATWGGQRANTNTGISHHSKTKGTARTGPGQ